jgi:hypothetical protein
VPAGPSVATVPSGDSTRTQARLHGAVADLAVAVSATGEKLARGGAGNCELAAAPDLCGAVR